MTRFLIDSNVFYWLADDPRRIPAAVRARLDDPDEQLYLSHASIWELCIKSALGKLPLPAEVVADPVSGFRQAAARARMELLSIDLHHSVAVLRLPHHHRDPFDRMLIAQAIEEDLTLVTSDRIFERYEALKLLKV